jgi:hypothetical protein
MKDYSVSQPAAPPASIKIIYDPTVDELMTDWLAERVQRAVEIAIDAAARCSVHLKEIWVEGWESYEEPTRELVVIPEIVALDNDGFEYWSVLAMAINKLNQPPPPGATNRDVTVQVSVRW